MNEPITILQYPRSCVVLSRGQTARRRPRPLQQTFQGFLYAMQIYFLWNNISNASIYPFLNIFFHRRGFSKSQIGWMAAIRPWVSAISGKLSHSSMPPGTQHRSNSLVSYDI